jgi:two-component system chemotaxis response regulator CheY
VLRTLLVEDDASIRDLLEAFLAPIASCDMAENGHAALAAIAQALDRGQPYELVCLDLVMPLMDGWETLKRLRQLEDRRGLGAGGRHKVIVLTARDSSQNIRQLMTAGPCEAFLLKPFRRGELFDQIRALGLPVPA